MKGYINMKDVDESGIFELPKEGKYMVKIDEVSESVSRNGDPMAKVMLRILDIDSQGALIWDNIVFPLDNSPAIRIKGRTKHFLHCIGEPYDGERLSYNTDNWIGKTVEIKVKHEGYESRTYAKVDSYILNEQAPEDIPF